MVELLGYPLSVLLLLSGTALVIAEAFAPGAHFVVLGVALLAAGIVGLLLPTGLGVLAPLVLAGVVIAAGVTSFYIYREFDFYGGKGTDQTSDSSSLRGKTGRVTERVTPSSGEVKLSGGGFNPIYQARSMDGEIAEGDEIMVIDPGGGNIVTVESITGRQDDIDRELARERRRSDGNETPGTERDADEPTPETDVDEPASVTDTDTDDPEEEPGPESESGFETDRT